MLIGLIPVCILFNYCYEKLLHMPLNMVKLDDYFLPYKSQGLGSSNVLFSVLIHSLTHQNFYTFRTNSRY